jgi:nitrogen regulatory protein PII
MTALGHIGYGVEKKLITLITVSGRGVELMALVENRDGVLSVTHHHARGTARPGHQRPGKIQWSERDVVMVLVEAPQADELFAQLFTAAELGEPHQGLIFMESVLRGHPMMPFAAE